MGESPGMGCCWGVSLSAMGCFHAGAVPDVRPGSGRSQGNAEPASSGPGALESKAAQLAAAIQTTLLACAGFSPPNR